MQLRKSTCVVVDEHGKNVKSRLLKDTILPVDSFFILDFCQMLLRKNSACASKGARGIFMIFNIF